MSSLYATYETANSSELYHHGIKGMKWGVRRFRRKDGSLTQAGKKRYAAISDSLNTRAKGHRIRLENKYKAKGMTKDEAKVAAEKQIKVEKAVAVLAGVTVGSCAAYYAKNKWVANHCDQILKTGTTFHNLDSAANPRPGEHLYVNYRKDDVNYFRGHFAVNKMRKTGSVFDHAITSTSEVKIPSLNTRKSVFKQLYDGDEEFRTVFNSHSRMSPDTKSAKKVYKAMWPKFGDKDDPEFNSAKRKYFEALKQKGYDAVVDEWDTKSTVYRSNAPLILLDTSSKSLGKMTIKELKAKDVLLAQANSKSWITKRDIKRTVTMDNFHTNHFKESNKIISKYAKKDSKNSEYINTFLNGFKDTNNADAVTKTLLETRRGSLAAKAGKYMTKDPNLTPTDAVKLVKQRDKTVTYTAYYSALGGFWAGSKVLSNNIAVEKYLAEHPRTRKTNQEIARMLVKQNQ